MQMETQEGRVDRKARAKTQTKVEKVEVQKVQKQEVGEVQYEKDVGVDEADDPESSSESARASNVDLDKRVESETTPAATEVALAEQ